MLSRNPRYSHFSNFKLPTTSLFSLSWRFLISVLIYAVKEDIIFLLLLALSRQTGLGHFSISILHCLVWTRFHHLLRIGRVIAVSHHFHFRGNRRNFSTRIHFCCSSKTYFSIAFDEASSKMNSKWCQVVTKFCPHVFQEIDGARIFSVYSMEMLQCVSSSLEKIYSIGSVRPGMFEFRLRPMLIELRT
jgi:hypothetical protein